MSDLPDRFIPDEPQTLGEPEPVSLGPEIDLPNLGGHDESPIPRCDKCGSGLTGCLGDDWLECVGCGRRHLTEAGRERLEERRREARRRREYNDGNFMPLSPSEWRERRGDRR